MATSPVGEVTIIPWEFVLQWRIKDFLSLSGETDEFYNSPSFYFDNSSWFLSIYPNGETEEDADGEIIEADRYISLYLSRNSSGSPQSIEFVFGVKTVDEKIDCEWKYTCIFTKDKDGWGCRKFIKRLTLFTSKSELVSSGDLTVICKIKYPKSANVAHSIGQAAECYHCKETIESDNILSHQRQCMRRPIKCQGCFDDILLQNMLDGHKCRNEKAVVGDVSLCEDLKKMLLDGRHHDIILKVGNREFQAHRDILRARSRVFESMFEHEMKEKESDSIDIKDCDAEAMEVFLSYIYSGTIDNLDQSNMFNLYYIADKYDMKGLKDVCREFIQESLSLTSICKIIQLATNHTDLCLLGNATEYFMGNVLEIMSTVEWQCFLKENTTVGNELLMKSIKKLKNT